MNWSELVTQANVGGVLDGVKDMLPSLLPISVGFIGIRKAISFLLGSLRRA